MGTQRIQDEATDTDEREQWTTRTKVEAAFRKRLEEGSGMNIKRRLIQESFCKKNRGVCFDGPHAAGMM
jgi:hypothetical protein